MYVMLSRVSCTLCCILSRLYCLWVVTCWVGWVVVEVVSRESCPAWVGCVWSVVTEVCSVCWVGHDLVESGGMSRSRLMTWKFQPKNLPINTWPHSMWRGPFLANSRSTVTLPFSQLKQHSKHSKLQGRYYTLQRRITIIQDEFERLFFMGVWTICLKLIVIEESDINCTHISNKENLSGRRPDFGPNHYKTCVSVLYFGITV